MRGSSYMEISYDSMRYEWIMYNWFQTDFFASFFLHGPPFPFLGSWAEFTRSLCVACSMWATSSLSFLHWSGLLAVSPPCHFSQHLIMSVILTAHRFNSLFFSRSRHSCLSFRRQHHTQASHQHLFAFRASAVKNIILGITQCHHMFWYACISPFVSLSSATQMRLRRMWRWAFWWVSRPIIYTKINTPRSVFTHFTFLLDQMVFTCPLHTIVFFH